MGKSAKSTEAHLNIYLKRDELEKLTPEQRTEIAKKAATARWSAR